MGSNGGGLIGLVALQDAVRIAGVPIERGSKQALKKILLRNAGAAGGDVSVILRARQQGVLPLKCTNRSQDQSLLSSACDCDNWKEN